jgi:hypothetical protein
VHHLATRSSWRYGVLDPVPLPYLLYQAKVTSQRASVFTLPALSHISSQGQVTHFQHAYFQVSSPIHARVFGWRVRVCNGGKRYLTIIRVVGQCKRPFQIGLGQYTVLQSPAWFRRQTALIPPTILHQRSMGCLLQPCGTKRDQRNYIHRRCYQ